VLCPDGGHVEPCRTRLWRAVCWSSPVLRPDGGYLESSRHLSPMAAAAPLGCWIQCCLGCAIFSHISSPSARCG